MGGGGVRIMENKKGQKIELDQECASQRLHKKYY